MTNAGVQSAQNSAGIQTLLDASFAEGDKVGEKLTRKLGRERSPEDCSERYVMIISQ
jgi:hypothetical protein